MCGHLWGDTNKDKAPCAGVCGVNTNKDKVPRKGNCRKAQMKKGPLVQRGLSCLWHDWRIVLLLFQTATKSAAYTDNPSDSLAASHLPLHRGGLKSVGAAMPCHLTMEPRSNFSHEWLITCITP